MVFSETFASLEFSSSPKGFLYTSNNLDTLSLKAEVSGKVVDLHWTASESLLQKLERFEVYRKRKDEAASQIAVFAPVLNTAGKYITNYSTTDLLSTEGIYIYEIIAIYKDSQLKTCSIAKPFHSDLQQVWILSFMFR